MKKRFLILVLALVLLLTFTSCVRQTVTADIEKDGGQVTHEVVITKELYTTLLSYSGGESTTEEDVEITYFTGDDGVEYVSFKSTETYDSMEDLNDYFITLGESTSEDDDASESLSGGKYFDYFYIFYNEGTDSIVIEGCFAYDGYENFADQQIYTSLKLVLNFPGDVMYCDFGTQIDENTVEIDMLDAMNNHSGESFMIEAKASDTPEWGWVVLGIIVVLLVIGVILLAVAAVIIVIIVIVVIIVIIAKKNKKKKAAKATQDSESSV